MPIPKTLAEAQDRMFDDIAAQFTALVTVREFSYTMAWEEIKTDYPRLTDSAKTKLWAKCCTKANDAVKTYIPKN